MLLSADNESDLTRAGNPAGNDPTAEELQQIVDVAGIFSWLGSDEPLRTAFILVLGGGQRRLRDLVYIPAGLWQATVLDLKAEHSAT